MHAAFQKSAQKKAPIPNPTITFGTQKKKKSNKIFRNLRKIHFFIRKIDFDLGAVIRVEKWIFVSVGAILRREM